MIIIVVVVVGSDDDIKVGKKNGVADSIASLYS